MVAKAYEALSKEGAFIVIETLIDDARRENTTGLMMSLNMLIEFGDAFDYSAADFRGGVASRIPFVRGDPACRRLQRGGGL